MSNPWLVGLCECGDCGNCCYSYCCLPFVFGEVKSMVDGSDYFFNSHYSGIGFNPMVTRWLVRSAYGIEGSSCEDCLVTYFCCPCAANQLYQTVDRLGHPTTEGGRYFNIEADIQPECTCVECCYVCACPCCMVGDSLKTALEMPWCMGCCCVSPCAASQLLRYQYRIKGSDIKADLILPSVYASCPCFIYCLIMWLLKIKQIPMQKENHFGTTYLARRTGVL